MLHHIISSGRRFSPKKRISRIHDVLVNRFRVLTSIIGAQKRFKEPLEEAPTFPTGSRQHVELGALGVVDVAALGETRRPL